MIVGGVIVVGGGLTENLPMRVTGYEVWKGETPVTFHKYPQDKNGVGTVYGHKLLRV